MLKKIIIICLGIFFLLGLYLYLVNWSIYNHLDKIGLKASDNRHEYVFNGAPNGEELIYVALGDSLTAGTGVDNYEDSYPYLVAARLAQGKTKLIHHNYSYQGARTADLMENLLPQALKENPNLVTLLIGTNDVQGNVATAVFRQNYEIIISRLKNESEAKINLISIPFIGADSVFLPPYNYYYHARIIHFNEIIKELAAKYQLNYIDLTTPTRKYASAAGPYYAADSFHPSAVGYSFWAQIIYDHLNY